MPRLSRLISPALAGLLAAGALAAPAGAVVGGSKTAQERGNFLVALIDSTEGRRTVAA